MEKSSENKADKLITGERFTYVPVDLKMGWKPDGDQFVGWSIDFPSVVVQAETINKEFFKCCSGYVSVFIR